MIFFNLLILVKPFFNGVKNEREMKHLHFYLIIKSELPYLAERDIQFICK